MNLIYDLVNNSGMNLFGIDAREKLPGSKSTPEEKFLLRRTLS